MDATKDAVETTSELTSSAQTSARKQRVEKPLGVRSPSILSVHMAGWLLLVCMFLPVCKSCSNTIERPVDGLALTPPIEVRDVVRVVTLLSVYGNGVLVATLLTISAYLASPTFWWRAFVIQYTLTVLIGLLFVALVVAQSPGSGTGSVPLENFLSCAPPPIAAALWIGGAIRRQARELAWARLQHCWTMGAFVYLHMLCLFNSQVLIGYWLTLLSLAGLVFAVELARYRMHHDLWDPTRPAGRPQFTLRKIFLWMTFFPLVVAYYQAIEPFCNWLYSSQ